MKNLIALAVAAVMIAPVAAHAAGAGVGIGATAGTYNATATSNAAPGGILIGNGSYNLTLGTNSVASSGMALGAETSVNLTVDNTVPNLTSTTTTQSSNASVQGFGTAGSTSFVHEQQNGLVLGGPAGATNGNANAAGAFLGIGLIGVVQP